MKTILDRNSKEKYHYRHITDDGMFDGTDKSFNIGDKVMIREWQPKDIGIIRNYYDLTFIIVTSEKEFTRAIVDFDEDDETITCISLNSAYPPFKLNLNEIKELYFIVKLIDKKR